jgi:hypothetical protein
MDTIVKFSKPYTFDNKEYKEVDLSAVENLSTKDLAQADTIFTMSGQVAAMNEMSIGYACIVASLATKLPIEFYEGLPGKDGIKVKNVIANFFYN